MVNTELVNTYKFTRPTGERVNVRVMYDNETQYVTHKYDADDIDNGHMHANWWRDALGQKPYHELMKANQILYNFLQAKLGE